MRALRFMCDLVAQVAHRGGKFRASGHRGISAAKAGGRAEAWRTALGSSRLEQHSAPNQPEPQQETQRVGIEPCAGTQLSRPSAGPRAAVRVAEGGAPLCASA